MNPASDTLDVLARTLWAEARSEGQVGLEAVASVILNRARHPRWWGSDVRSVCLKPRQFSCWNADDPQRVSIRTVGISDPKFRLARDVAAAALAGTLVDRTGGADSYANLRVCDPAWSHGRMPSAVIGAHTFYRLELPLPGGANVAPAKPAAETPTTAQLNDAALAKARG